MSNDLERDWLRKLYESYSYEQISRLVGCSLGSVYKWIKQEKPISRMARATIRKKMEESNGQGNGGNKTGDL